MKGNFHVRFLGDKGSNAFFLPDNPVKHGLVRTVKDWPYSSFHRLVAAGIYPLEWTGDIFEAFEVGELDD